MNMITETAARWFSHINLRDNPDLARKTVISVIALSILGGVSWGLGKLDAKVRQLPRYDNALALQWVNVPDWLRLDENRHILETLTREANLQARDRLLDPDLAKRLGSALARPSLGWVKAVDRVMVRPDGIVSVSCEFREPKAWVLYKNHCYLVDAESVRLPGSYEPADCEGSRLLMITGVAKAPPRVGEVWDGADLQSGLKLVQLVEYRPFHQQVRRILVANAGGRVDKNKPHLEMSTDRPNSRIWWGRAPNQEYGTEISAYQKLTLLDSLYQKWGRIDLNRSYVDVRTHTDGVVAPTSSRRIREEPIARR